MTTGRINQIATRSPIDCRHSTDESPGTRFLSGTGFRQTFCWLSHVRLDRTRHVSTSLVFHSQLPTALCKRVVRNSCISLHYPAPRGPRKGFEKSVVLTTAYPTDYLRPNHANGTDSLALIARRFNRFKCRACLPRTLFVPSGKRPRGIARVGPLFSRSFATGAYRVFRSHQHVLTQLFKQRFSPHRSFVLFRLLSELPHIYSFGIRPVGEPHPFDTGPIGLHVKTFSEGFFRTSKPVACRKALPEFLRSYVCNGGLLHFRSHQH